MALLNNFSVFNSQPARLLSGQFGHVRNNFNTRGGEISSFTHFGKYASRPSGYSAPYSWSMSRAIGAMSSFTQSGGLISPTINLAGGQNLTATINLSMTMTNAQLDQIVTLVASALLSIIGSGSLNASVNLQASAVLAIASSANIGAIVDALASSSSTISVNAILSALANMTAEAGGAPILSPEGLAQAVWDKDITGFLTAGTAGKQLSDAGGAGNPWGASLASNNTAGTFGNLVQKLLTVAKFIGLK